MTVVGKRRTASFLLKYRDANSGAEIVSKRIGQSSHCHPFIASSCQRKHAPVRILLVPW